ncbi:MAG TPA: nucleotidyltransferase family protein [Woeseiaceae bacterium]|nr:nucleotidyltransferase family protein [Woeseiaceae bacterium]
MPMHDEKLFALVLAAGGGSRFGGKKQLQAYQGTPLVARAVRLAESVCGPRTLLVTGSDWRAVFEACMPLEGFLLRNEEWRSGIGSSIAAGTRAVAASADALLLLLADQPLITREHLEALIAAWNGSPRHIVATTFADVAGPPVLFPARYFPALAALEGDRGARQVLAAAAAQVLTLTFEPAAVDIDRAEDLARLP